jgi:hypothetical protein
MRAAIWPNLALLSVEFAKMLKIEMLRLLIYATAVLWFSPVPPKIVS